MPRKDGTRPEHVNLYLSKAEFTALEREIKKIGMRGPIPRISVFCQWVIREELRRRGHRLGEQESC